MTLEQNVRLWANRLRRRVIGGERDHAPEVVIEGARPLRIGGWRGSAKRALRSTVAFLATFALLAGGYIAFVAAQGEVRADLAAPVAAPPARGAASVAAAASLLSLEAEPVEDESRNLFLPTRRAARLAYFREGAASAVASFVEVVERRRPGRDPDLTAAERLLMGQGQRYAEARDALRRFNAGGARKGRAVDPSPAALAALARAAAAQSAAEQAALAAVAARGRLGLAEGEAERAFYRARGQAYAYRRLIEAYEADLPQGAAGPFADAYIRALEALGRAASFEPRLLVNAPADHQGWAPNHPAKLADRLKQAEAAALALAEAAEAS